VIATDRPRRGPAARVRTAAGLTVAACTIVTLLGVGTGLGALTATTTVSPSKWSGTVCTALVSYKNDAAKLEKAFEKSIKNPKSLSEVKAKFTAFLKLNVARANKLVGQLKKAGTPSTPNGGDFANAITAGFVQLRDGFKGLVPTAQAVPTDSASNFESAFQALESNLNDLQTANQGTFQQADQFASPALNSAFQNQKACQSLNNG